MTYTLIWGTPMQTISSGEAASGDAPFDDRDDGTYLEVRHDENVYLFAVDEGAVSQAQDLELIDAGVTVMDAPAVVRQRVDAWVDYWYGDGRS